MKRILLLAMVFCAVFALPVLAGVELTPFAGYRFGGDMVDPVDDSTASLEEGACFGLMLDYELEPGSQVELFWSHRDAELSSTFTDDGPDVMDLRVDYIHLGGTYGERMGAIEPFVVGGLGVTHFNPATDGYDAKTRFSMNLGLGAKAFLTERLGLRVEARAFGTFFDGSGDILCGPRGCFARLESSVWTQFAFHGGVVLAF